MKQYRKQNPDKAKNHLIIAAIIVISFLILGIRIGQFSLIKKINHHDLLAIHADSNHLPQTLKRRGTITDSHQAPIAIDRKTYTVHALLNNTWNEENIKNPDETARQLATVLDLSHEEILEVLLTPEVVQVEFGPQGRGLSEDDRQALEDLQLPGIIFSEEMTRRYVNDYFASHFIGYALPEEILAENDQQQYTGQIGVELIYDELLNGTADQEDQQDVQLTIDKRLQNYLEELLTESYNKFRPENVAGHLVEVKTGRLLATSQRPSFNLNTLEGLDDRWQHLLVESAIEPGSTIKILTVASAYDRKVFEADERIMSGEVAVYDQIVKDHNLVGWGEISFEEGLIRSSNVAMVELVQRMGSDEWMDELKKYGFGKSTESGFQAEVTGHVELENPVTKIMSGFGQGFSASPIQLLEAFSALANQGEKVQLSFVDQIGEQEIFHPTLKGQVMSAEAAAYVLDLMQQTVEAEIGTAQSFQNESTSVAAKTGTAEIASIDEAGYLTGENDYIHSVIAFFPAENPEYMLYLLMEQPAVNHGLIGSQILNEIFNPFVDYIMINQ